MAILGAIGPVEAWMSQAYCVKVSSKSESPFVFTDREKGMLLLLSVPCFTRGPVCGEFEGRECAGPLILGCDWSNSSFMIRF